LRESWPHSPAAGRFTAVNLATGRYLFIVDADMELLPGYVERALAVLQSNPDVVGVRGRLHNYHVIEGEQRYVNSTWGGSDSVSGGGAAESAAHEVEAVMGAALFRLDAIRAVGNFHPYLRAEEEFELCQRLRRSGGRLLYLPIDAVNHFGYLPEPLKEVRRRWKAGLIGGVGQMVRVSALEGFGPRNVWRFRKNIALGGFLLLFPCAVACAWTNALGLWVWLSTFLAVLLLYYRQKRDLTQALAALLLKGLSGIDIFRACVVPVPDKRTYPTDVVMVDSAPGSIT
jgi:hypothetical protein